MIAALRRLGGLEPGELPQVVPAVGHHGQAGLHGALLEPSADRGAHRRARSRAGVTASGPARGREPRAARPPRRPHDPRPHRVQRQPRRRSRCSALRLGASPLTVGVLVSLYRGAADGRSACPRGASSTAWACAARCSPRYRARHRGRRVRRARARASRRCPSRRSTMGTCVHALPDRRAARGGRHEQPRRAARQLQLARARLLDLQLPRAHDRGRRDRPSSGTARRSCILALFACASLAISSRSAQALRAHAASFAQHRGRAAPWSCCANRELRRVFLVTGLLASAWDLFIVRDADLRDRRSAFRPPPSASSWAASPRRRSWCACCCRGSSGTCANGR